MMVLPLKRHLFITGLMLSLFCLLPVYSVAQLVQSGELIAHVDDIISSMPSTVGGSQYMQPNSASRELWREIINHILAGEYEDAHTKALTKNYQVVLWTDTEFEPHKTYVLFERTSDSSDRYWGTYIFNTEPSRSKLVIESPHPKYDTNTGYQGLRIFLSSDAWVFLVAGTHRCNGTTQSPCSGTTSACGGSNEPYRYSDQAHVVDGPFQVVTEELLNFKPDMIVVQPHGFSKGDGDPDLIISNGTWYDPSGTDYAAAISDAFLADHPSMTTKVAHIDFWTKLIGTTNTQGRLLNGSSNPCSSNPSSATGNFVHIEQAKPGLRDTPSNWMKLANAMIDAIPEEVESTEESGAALPSGFGIVGNYSNPFNSSTRVVYRLAKPGDVSFEVYTLQGRLVEEVGLGVQPAGEHDHVWTANALGSGMYILQIRQGAMRDQKRCILVR